VISVATLEKLVNRGALFNMSIKLANRVALLVNRENGERSGTRQLGPNLYPFAC